MLQLDLSQNPSLSAWSPADSPGVQGPGSVAHLQGKVSMALVEERKQECERVAVELRS